VYEAIYAVISLAQAQARVWRLGQYKSVRVFSISYEGNLEQDAWRVIAKKIAWSKSVYGDFIPSGLGAAGLDENLDLLSALTEAIARPETGNGQAEDTAMLQTNLAGVEHDALNRNILIPRRTSSSTEPGRPATVTTLEEWLSYYGTAQPTTRRRGAETPDSQLSWF
jgi:hypothetical protein